MKVLVALVAFVALASAWTNEYQYQQGPYSPFYAGLHLGVHNRQPVESYPYHSYWPSYLNQYQRFYGQEGRYPIEFYQQQQHHQYPAQYGYNKMYNRYPTTDAVEKIAEVATHHALDKSFEHGQDVKSVGVQLAAVENVHNVLDHAEHFGMIAGQDQHSHIKHVLAVALAQRVLEHRQITGQSTGSSYAQAIAVAAAQQAFDALEHQGYDVTEHHVQYLAEMVVDKVIDDAQLGQFFGSHSMYIQSIAVDSANRAIEYVKAKGFDVSSEWVRAVAIAAAQQALDKQQIEFGVDIGSNTARTIAIAAAQQMLEDIHYGKYENVHQYLTKFFLPYTATDKYFNFQHLYKQFQTIGYGQELPYYYGKQYQGYGKTFVPSEHYQYLNKFFTTYMPTPYYPTEFKGLSVGKTFQKTLFGGNYYNNDALYKYGKTYQPEQFYKSYDYTMKPYQHLGQYHNTPFTPSYYTPVEQVHGYYPESFNKMYNYVNARVY